MRAVADAIPSVPLVATGGIATEDDVIAMLRAGAGGVQLGTALLLTEEAGTPLPHRMALLASATLPASTETTAFTRGFSGRWARGLRNSYMVAHEPAVPAAAPPPRLDTNDPLLAQLAQQLSSGGGRQFAAPAEAKPSDGPFQFAATRDAGEGLPPIDAAFLSFPAQNTLTGAMRTEAKALRTCGVDPTVMEALQLVGAHFLSLWAGTSARASVARCGTARPSAGVIVREMADAADAAFAVRVRLVSSG